MATTTKSIANEDPWQASTEYALKARVNNDSGKIYVCTTAGESAGSGGPAGTGTGISDNTCVWDFVVDPDYADTVAWEDFVDDDIDGNSDLQNNHVGEVYGIALANAFTDFNGFNTVASTGEVTLRAATGESFHADEQGSATRPLFYDENPGGGAAIGNDNASSVGNSVDISGGCIHITIERLQITNNRAYVRTLEQDGDASGDQNFNDLILHSKRNNSSYVFVAHPFDGTMRNVIACRDGVVNLAMFWSHSGTHTFYNCLAAGRGTETGNGWEEAYATATLINCIGFGYGTDFDSGWGGSSDYNAGSDTSAPGTNAVDNLSSTNGVDFVAPGTGDDWRAVAGGALDSAGTTDSGSAPTEDIYGQTRAATPWIGPYEVIGGVKFTHYIKGLQTLKPMENLH